MLRLLALLMLVSLPARAAEPAVTLLVRDAAGAPLGDVAVVLTAAAGSALPGARPTAGSRRERGRY